MKNLVLTLLLSVLSSNDVFCQDVLPVFEPTVNEGYPDLSLKAQVDFQRRDELLSRQALLNDALSKEEETDLNNLLDKYDEIFESIWDTIGAGCSWYCGGSNYDIKASSVLASQVGKNTMQNQRMTSVIKQLGWKEKKIVE